LLPLSSTATINLFRGYLHYFRFAEMGGWRHCIFKG
jgi:hypothetical protein